MTQSRSRAVAATNDAVSATPARQGHPVRAASRRGEWLSLLQAKLTISEPGDRYEEEADRVADQVMRMPDPASASIDPTPIRALSLQRRCAQCEDEALRRKARDPQAETVDSGLDAVAATLRGAGRPLDPATRGFFEPRFGVDFGGVRIHTDSQAAASARSVNALAYTVGRDVVFNTGQYAPHSDSGKRLLAHELTHVVQQGTALRRQPFPVSTGVTPRIARQGPDAGTGDAGTPGTGSAAQPSLAIARQGGNANTFVSTDTLSLSATVTGSAPDAGTPQISWTVQGVSANSGNGNPHTAANTSNFSFKPNPTNRPTTGSRTANDPIQYRVDAQAGGVTASYALQQDETDIIRQEYIDFGASTTPARADIVAPAIATFNTGNYALVVDGGMSNALTNTETEFATLTQQAAAPAAGAGSPDAGTPAPVPVPAISVSSAYRNPRRNVAAGSQFPTGSRHVWGSALDLTVAGANATLWARLRQAGANAGNSSICEDGPTQKPCNDATVDHVHIQW